MTSINRLDAVRTQAETIIDQHFALRMEKVIGPLGLLHMIKRQQAQTGGGILVAADRDAVMQRAAEQDELLLAIETERLRLKSDLRSAVTVADVKLLLLQLKEA